MHIRNEEPRDHEAVEALTRRAFYNLYVPGCVEHYLVHIVREHKDFIPELDFVLEEDGRIIGNIMYTRARLVDETGAAVILKNNTPRYVLIDFSQLESEQQASDEDVLAISRRLMAKNKEAYEVLAK